VYDLCLGANRLKINVGEGLEDLSHGSVMWQGPWGVARCLGGAGRRGQVNLRPPATLTCLLYSCFAPFCTNVAKKSCIQIIVQVQVELGEL
jgi:hypothetical protein